MIGASADNVVYVSDQWGKNLISFQNASDAQILLKAAPGVPLEEVQFEARRLMRQIRRLKPQESDDFAVNKMSMITEAISSLFIQIRKIGVIIGGFAMVVGCFGVANIMFVSVKERTREIGIQKALGAKNIAISAQFLMESIWLSIAGGIIGLLAVQMVLWLLGMVVQQQFGNDVVLSLSPSDTLLGVVTSVIVGLVAGIIPARSAARLNPVDAIRSS
jgi:putative ABC transport system permease protein